MDEGRAILTAHPEVLFTYPSPMGDYDKIGRPSLQDGVRRLTRFSPREDPVQLSSSENVRGHPGTTTGPPNCGVTRLGPDGCFLYFDVVLSISSGVFRATVRLARTTMEPSGLTRWNVAEIAVLITLRACLEGKDYAEPLVGVI